jgi:hypothetical protein
MFKAVYFVSDVMKTLVLAGIRTAPYSTDSILKSRSSDHAGSDPESVCQQDPEKKLLGSKNIYKWKNAPNKMASSQHTKIRTPPSTQELMDRLAVESERNSALEGMVRLSTMTYIEQGTPTTYNPKTGEPEAFKWEAKTYFQDRDFLLTYGKLHKPVFVGREMAKEIIDYVGKEAIIVPVGSAQYAVAISKQPTSTGPDTLEDLDYLIVRRVHK